MLICSSIYKPPDLKTNILQYQCLKNIPAFPSSSDSFPCSLLSISSASAEPCPGAAASPGVKSDPGCSSSLAVSRSDEESAGGGGPSVNRPRLGLAVTEKGSYVDSSVSLGGAGDIG